MTPITYNTMLTFHDNKFDVRLHMVQYAIKHDIRSTSRAFQCSINTVRLWLRRYEQQGLSGLQDRSRAPKRIPHKMPKDIEEKIVKLRTKLKTWDARRLKRDFDIPCSHNAIQRIYHPHGLVRPRKHKHQRKRLLKEIKAYEQICTDTKELKDIPKYWEQMYKQRLPAMQYTARDVRSEFVGSYDSKDKSGFSSVVEEKYQARHVRIPPGAYTYNSDAESFHRTIEDEFYDIEEFRDRAEFMNKLITYLIFYNMVRKNSNKDWKSPWEILEEIAPDSRLDIKLCMPIF